MNEALLNSLARTAGMDLRPQWDDGKRQMVNELSADQLAFAQLVVLEAISTVESAMYNSGDEWDRALRFAVADLREHFKVGV